MKLKIEELGYNLETLRRKANQAWEMAGFARQDNDKVDEARRTADAREYDRLIGVLKGNQP